MKANTLNVWVKWQGCCYFCITGRGHGQIHRGPLLWRIASLWKMRKKVDGEVMLWPPWASRAGILGKPQPTWEGRRQSHALPYHCLSVILFSVKVYGRDILENLYIQHQQKSSGTLPNRESQITWAILRISRNITGMAFETFPNLPYPCFPCTSVIKSRPRLDT